LVVGEFKTQIENEIKGYKNQIEALRNQFKELSDDIGKLEEKNRDNLDMYSTLQRQLKE
jgi:archaellum component FlaC